MKKLFTSIIVLFLYSGNANAAFSATAIGQDGISATFKKFSFTGAKTKQEALDSAILKCRTALELQWGCRIIRYEHWNDNTGKQKILQENDLSYSSNEDINVYAGSNAIYEKMLENLNNF